MLQRLRHFLKVHLAIILVILSYGVMTVSYMGPSIWNCNTTLYGFGDNTAGPIWRYGLEPKQAPLGNYQYKTNYPIGEDQYSPVSVSLAGQSVLIWGSSRAFGPICGYNIVNMVGFVASALVMYGFIYALTKKRWIAWLAGYAVSFAPYYQMKVGGHPGYGYQALLIGAAWAFFNLAKRKTKKDAGIFAAVLAACFYFDPYFSLLATLLMAPIILTWLRLTWIKGKFHHIKSFFKDRGVRLVVFSGVLFVAVLLPLIFTIVKNNAQISSTVASLRGNVFFEAKACSNLPHEYLLPFVLHPIFTRAIGEADYVGVIDHLHNGFSCGIGEDTVGISMIILTITSLGLIVMVWEKLKKRKLNFELGYDKKLIIYGMLAALCVALLFGLPPIKLFGVIPSPSYMLLELTTTWRTLTRMYVIVNFAVITLFSIVLIFVMKNFKQHKKALKIIFILIVLGVFVEYMAFRPFTGNKLSTFDYSKDVPAAYIWLRDQESISVIAEYPLERAGGESNAMAYYLSMQVAHNKVLFNGNTPTSYEESLRASLKDLSDPQTLSVLRAVGVNAVVIHGVTAEKIEAIEGLEVVHVESQPAFNILAYTPLVKNDITVIAKITAAPKKQMLALGDGFVRNTTIIRSSIDWEYEAINNSILNVATIPGVSTISDSPQKYCFAVRMSGEVDLGVVDIIVDGAVVQKFNLGSAYKEVSVIVLKNIQLRNDKGFNMRVKDFGCRSN